MKSLKAVSPSFVVQEGHVTSKMPAVIPYEYICEKCMNTFVKYEYICEK